MPPKRPAPEASAASKTKKAKAAEPKTTAKVAKGAKASKKAAAAPKSTLAVVAESVKKGAQTAAAEIDTAVDVAGDLLIDDVAPEPEKKKGKKAAAAKKAAPAGPTMMETVKKGAKKAAADISAAVDKAGDLLVDDVADEPEKKTKGTAAPRGTKRKTADDYMSKAEKAAASVADKPTSNKTATAKGKGKKAAEPESEEEDGDEGSEASFIGAFESDDEMGGADSSDDESDDEDAAVAAAGRTQIDVSKLPASKDDKSVAARLKKAAKKRGVPRGTIFLGRIPHGFYEEQMKEYFNQFGDVTRLRLARNPKTGASRHYAYVEFSSEAVAEIVAETMNHYLLMGHLLRCEVIPADDVHPELWVGANKKWRLVPRARLEKVRQDKSRTKEEQERANANLLKRQEERRQKIKAAGIDYEFDGHQ